jgi:ferric-dicitrate binding protein FerR (iron transport regulator)
MPALAAAGLLAALLVLATLPRRAPVRPAPASPPPAAEAPAARELAESREEREHAERSLAALRLEEEAAARARDRAELEAARRKAEEELSKVRAERQAEEARVIAAREREREAARPTSPPPAPTTAAVASLETEGKTRALPPGGSVTTSQVSASLTFGDGARVELAPGTEIRDIHDAPGKRLRLLKGRLTASVPRQAVPASFLTPYGEAAVLGTTFRLSVESASTRLDVHEGKVRFTRLDGRSVDVAGGHYLLSTEPAARPLVSRARYEAAVAKRADILFLEDFEASDWKRRWSSPSESSRVSDDRGIVLLGRRSLEVRRGDGWHRITLPAGVPTLHVRAYVYFPDAHAFGTTLFRTGAGAEDGKSLWADFRPDGRDFFSAALVVTRRGALQFHLFHPEQADPKGDFRDGAAAPLALAPGRWHAVELMCRANDPGRRNGAVLAWINGSLAAEVDGLRFRDVDTLNLREMALPGTGGAPYFVDHVALARDVVGAAPGDVDGVPLPNR